LHDTLDDDVFEDGPVKLPALAVRQGVDCRRALLIIKKSDLTEAVSFFKQLARAGPLFVLARTSGAVRGGGRVDDHFALACLQDVVFLASFALCDDI